MREPVEAIKLVDEYKGNIDLLITDVLMPEINGPELAAKLQDRQPDLKTLYMSGYTADVIAQNSELETGVHFLQKPFTRDSLAQRVREVLDR